MTRTLLALSLACALNAAPVFATDVAATASSGTEIGRAHV